MNALLKPATAIRTSLLLATATLIFFTPGSLSAQEKLGARMAPMKRISTVVDAQPVKAGDLVSMSCPKCKSTWISRIEKPGKTGAPAGQSQTLQHQCPGCKAKLSIEGHGKSKSAKVIHVCSQCGSKNAFCCVIGSGQEATTGMERDLR